jgi:hypothetical protein
MKRIAMLATTASLLGLMVAHAQTSGGSTQAAIERLTVAYMEQFNNHNAAGLAALFVKDGAIIAPTKSSIGADAVIERYEGLFKLVT